MEHFLLVKKKAQEVVRYCRMKMKKPKVFMAYSWDSEEHKIWVRKLSEDLVENGVNVIFDQWDLRGGKDVAQFMKQIPKCDFTLIVCTHIYARKANEKKGGAGLEFSIITGEMMTNIDEDKFIPLLREGDQGTSVPIFLKTRWYIDFRNDKNYDNSFEELLRVLHNDPKFKRPSVS